MSREISGARSNNEPNWATGSYGPLFYESLSYESYLKPEGEDSVKLPVQQGDLLRDIYMDIVKYGLDFAFHTYKSVLWTGPKEIALDNRHTKTKYPKHVIIVGAGMAGLSAGFELLQAGHNVTILESQNRIGGRVKTFDYTNSDFDKDLFVDGGAMRLPLDDKHFLTDYYIKSFPDLKLVPFNNADENAFVKFYNSPPVRHREWNDKTDFTKHWPGWDERIVQTGVKKSLKIDGIGDYYNKTVGYVTGELRRKLRIVLDEAKDGEVNRERVSQVWEEWIDNWSRFPLNGFLQCSAKMVKMTLSCDYITAIDFNTLDKLIPWPDEALTAYSVYNYTEQLDQCLVQYLRDELGEWWTDDMQHIDHGMSELPKSFLNLNIGWENNINMEEKIRMNSTVTKIKYTSNQGGVKQVKVTAVNIRDELKKDSTLNEFEITGDAVIITTPLHIIRQITISPDTDSPDFPPKVSQALEDIWYGPSTKLMLQTEKRFWETCDSTTTIKGGFSKTNLPIGQLHYPTAVDNLKTDRGILLVYTWKSEALQFGALPPKFALAEAAEQISTIHPEILQTYKGVGAVEAWYNEPTAQGAYALLKPHQYRNVRRLMYPVHNVVYLAGEGISNASGWIQGALESGLRAAYQFYERNETENSGQGK